MYRVQEARVTSGHSPTSRSIVSSTKMSTRTSKLKSKILLVLFFSIIKVISFFKKEAKKVPIIQEIAHAEEAVS